MNKLLSCRFNMDTSRVESRFADGSTVAIDCIPIEDEYGDTTAQRSELDWLLYNKPLEYAQLVLGREDRALSVAWLRPWQTGRLITSKGHCHLSTNRIYYKQESGRHSAGVADT